MSVADQYAAGIALLYSKLIDLTGKPVSFYNRQQTGNLSGTGDTTVTWTGPVHVTVTLLKPRTVDDIIDPEHQAGFTLDEYWTMFYPTSATVRYRDVVTMSGPEGVANYIVTGPENVPWGSNIVMKQTTIRRVTNMSGGGYVAGQGATGWPG